MSNNRPRQIVVGVTGGIAAYKTPELIRRLIDHGCVIRVVMTEGAQAFITPLTLQAVSGNPVATSLLDEEAEAAMGHIELARWADAIVIAPATADVMARIATGIADDLLTTLCLATDALTIMAPAMNRLMWANPATRHNSAILKSRGWRLIGPATGSQACGETGPGRMVEPDEIVREIMGLGHELSALAGKKAVVTAGPTVEDIDPVRFISNRSSGKMGYAMAQALLDAGMEVVLVSGPVAIAPPADCQVVNVRSAREMLNATMAALDGCSILIASAAVADYAPTDSSSHKIKKEDGANLVLELSENPDILATVTGHESRPAFCVGFAAETQDLEQAALKKLAAKNLDAIVANRVGAETGGFDRDENAAIYLSRSGLRRSFELMAKQELAQAIVNLIADEIESADATADRAENP